MADGSVTSTASHRPDWQFQLVLCSGMALTTWIGVWHFAKLGVTLLTLLYMLWVLWAAYFLRFATAMGTAIAAVLLINFCFIEPRYTLRVASLHSWVMLVVFAVLAFTVSRAMQQLKLQTHQAQLAAQQSRFFQLLAEVLSNHLRVEDLLQAACQQIQQVFGWQVCVVQLRPGMPLQRLAGESALLVQPASVQWALDYQRAIGAGTQDWPELGHCLIPFGLPHHEVMVVAMLVGQAPDLHFLQRLVHQCAEATLKLRQQIALADAARETSEAQFKKTLLTALSHDMRTPLTAILGAANVLADQQITLAPTQSSQLLQSIQAEAGYLSQATENILTLVKLEAGERALHREWQSLQEVVQHVMQRYLQRTPPVSLAFTKGDKSEEWLVHMDAVLVAHALSNLVDNALQWRTSQTPVALHLLRDGDWLVLSVMNEGPSFPPDFEIASFHARRSARSGSRGFGLGLSIVNTIMQLHQGQLQLAQTPHQASPDQPAITQLTCVRMLFPFVPATAFTAGEPL
jgi:two-component system, OmpR family, sensor histidine kinase KdpD